MTDFSKIEPRPTSATQQDREAAAGKLVDRMIGRKMLEEFQRADAIRDIAKRGGRHMDGYELAKKLDEWDAWDCDLQMAEELDSFSLLLGNEIRRRQHAWVEVNKILPPFPPGTRVIAKHGRKELPGVIDDIYGHGPAQYEVRLDGDADPSRRAIVYFEDVRLPEPEPAA